MTRSQQLTLIFCKSVMLAAPVGAVYGFYAPFRGAEDPIFNLLIIIVPSLFEPTYALGVLVTLSVPVIYVLIFVKLTGIMIVIHNHTAAKITPSPESLPPSPATSESKTPKVVTNIFAGVLIVTLLVYIGVLATVAPPLVVDVVILVLVLVGMAGIMTVIYDYTAEDGTPSPATSESKTPKVVTNIFAVVITVVALLYIIDLAVTAVPPNFVAKTIAP